MSSRKTNDVRNSITYTTQGEDARIEQTTTLRRDRKLTYSGAERILRRETGDKSLVVTRIETMLVA